MIKHKFPVIYTAAFFVLALLCFGTLARAQNFAYVTNSGSKSVSVIDTASNTVTATVPVGSFPRGVAITPFVTFSAFSGSLDIFAGPPPGFQFNGTFTLGTGGFATGTWLLRTTLNDGTYYDVLISIR